jgi:hypothetical protein
MTVRSRDWVREFLYGTARGRKLRAELEDLEQHCAPTGCRCTQEHYPRLVNCWLRIVGAACEYAAVSTASDYVGVLRRFQHGMQDVMQALGEDLDAVSPAVRGPAAAPRSETHRGRAPLWLIGRGSVPDTPDQAAGSEDSSREDSSL